MIKTERQLRVPDWSKNSVNRWADYIELLCLYTDDHFVAEDDILDLFFEEEDGRLHRGESGHSERSDRLSAKIENYFEIICYRSSMYTESYPFDVEDRLSISIKTSLTVRHLHYIFLLLCSNICFMDQESVYKVTHAFERYCYPLMKILMPVDAQTELFGTTRDGDSLFKGNLRARIGKLADCLGAYTTKAIDQDDRYDRICAGDGGLDIVSFLKLDDASHIPVAFGQCTCSYDEWINKQVSISYGVWRRKIESLAPLWCYMYVPFVCHSISGKFEQPAEIHTCLIDRQRILNILERHMGLYQEEDSLELKKLIQEVW